MRTATLTARYVAALATIAALSIAGQVLVQTILETHRTDSRVINVAGRQRMLSQRIVKTVLVMNRPESRIADRLVELQALAEEWRGVHAGLSYGDPRRGLPGTNSARVAASLTAVGPHFTAMSEALETLLAAPPGADIGDAEDSGAIAVLLAHEGPYLEGMDRIVGLYEQESGERVQTLQRLELGLLVLVLMTLVFEGWLVFHPAVGRIRETMARLRHSESEKAAMLRAIPDTLLRVADDGRIIAAFAAPGDDPVAHGAEILAAAEARPDAHYRERLLQAIAERREIDFEFQRAVAGELQHLEARLVPCGQDDALIIIRDISERRRLERELLLASEREQARIGQDLHDGLCQHLAGLSMMTRSLANQVAAGKVAETADLGPDLDTAAELLGQALTSARRTVYGLFPEILVDRGLAEALRAACSTVEALHKIECRADIELRDVEFDQSLAVQLYRIAQEALGNAIRHGHASRITLTAGIEAGELVLEVRDDGIGLSGGGDEHSGGRGDEHSDERTGGLGLRSMAARARLIGAKLDIGDNHPTGVTVVCRMPLP